MSQANSVTGLTDDEVKIVKKNWSIVSQDLKGFAFDVFEAFFTAHPETQAYFPSFKDVPLAEIRGNKKVLGHAYNVLYAFAALLDNLDDPETLNEMLIKHGRNHGKRNNDFSWFIELGRIIGVVVSERLGPEISTEFAGNAFQKTWVYMIGVIKTGLDEESSK